MMNQNFSVIDKINEQSRIEKKTILCSRQVDLNFGPYQTEQKKEIEMIKKQNNTFKKELANYRKENTSLKRQTEEQKSISFYIKNNLQYLKIETNTSRISPVNSSKCYNHYKAKLANLQNYSQNQT